jgi:hypothetical protein
MNMNMNTITKMDTDTGIDMDAGQSSGPQRQQRNNHQQIAEWEEDWLLIKRLHEGGSSSTCWRKPRRV